MTMRGRGDKEGEPNIADINNPGEAKGDDEGGEETIEKETELTVEIERAQRGEGCGIDE
jgi:hypothetical protein